MHSLRDRISYCFQSLFYAQRFTKSHTCSNEQNYASIHTYYIIFHLYLTFSFQNQKVVSLEVIILNEFEKPFSHTCHSSSAPTARWYERYNIQRNDVLYARTVPQRYTEGPIGEKSITLFLLSTTAAHSCQGVNIFEYLMSLRSHLIIGSTP